MGRYAFFSTGLEYKFVFATQESSDIRMFGGVMTTRKEDIDCGKFSHLWNRDKDGPYALDQLNTLIAGTDISLPDFSTFSFDLDGTHTLRYWLYEHERTLYRQLSSDCHAFTLGCLLYHQLLYEPKLYVRYDV